MPDLRRHVVIKWPSTVLGQMRQWAGPLFWTLRFVLLPAGFSFPPLCARGNECPSTMGQGLVLQCVEKELDSYKCGLPIGRLSLGRGGPLFWPCSSVLIYTKFGNRMRYYKREDIWARRTAHFKGRAIDILKFISLKKRKEKRNPLVSRLKPFVFRMQTGL